MFSALCITLNTQPMLDNIRLQFKDKSLVEKWFRENEEKFPPYQMKRIFTTEGEFNTYPIVADIENLKLRICDKIAYLEGSIHKLYNYLSYNDLEEREMGDYDHLKDNNYNDFYYVQCIQAMESLKEFFDGLDLNDASISELEFGFNLLTEREPSEYKDMNFLLYEYKAPQNNYSKAGNYFNKFEHSKYAFKVYSKKDQKRLRTNIMRVEIVLKSNHLKDIGIEKYDDLMMVENIESLYNFFCEKFENFILIDNRQEKPGISRDVLNELGNYLEPSYWRGRKNRANTNRIKLHFQKLLRDYDMLTTKEYFKGLINNKFNQLCHGVINEDG